MKVVSISPVDQYGIRKAEVVEDGSTYHVVETKPKSGVFTSTDTKREYHKDRSGEIKIKLRAVPVKTFKI